MTWTFDTADLSTDLNKVRTYIGDTNESDPLLSDEQIDFALDEEGSVRSASALCAEWISALFSRNADKNTGDLSISYSQKSKQYAELASRLRSRAAETAMPYFGGISQTTKSTREADSDRVDPAFTVDMLDRPGISGTDSDEEDA